MKCLIYIFFTFFAFISPAFAAGSTGNPVVPILFFLIIIIVFAKIGGHIASTFHQPEVLGELLVGLILGSLSFCGIHFFEFLKHNDYLSVLSELGIILLLFEAGLETDLDEMKKLGWSSFFVAAIGIVFPFFLGW